MLKMLSQNRYKVLIDSDESDINELDNDNDQLSNIVTASTTSQVNLRNYDVKKDRHTHNSKRKKEIKKDCSITVAAGSSIVKKLKGWELFTKDDLFVSRSFSGA